ncbi:MAG: hypothetical protein NVV63_18400 [Opitutus sp.]|nr:hypothetical protein [Opitutus sp.]
MEVTTIELRRDSVYVITTHECVWSEEGKGRWAVRDGMLVLDGRGYPKEKRDKLTRFEIVAVDGDLALRPVNDEVESEDREADALLFTLAVLWAVLLLFGCAIRALAREKLAAIGETG